MFDKLIDSAPERRKRRFLRFLFGTSLLYMLALTSALVVSVVVANPELVHPSDLKVTSLVPPPPKGNADTPQIKQAATAKPSQPDIYHPTPTEDAVIKPSTEPTAERSNNPPTGGVGSRGWASPTECRMAIRIHTEPFWGSNPRGSSEPTEPPPPPPVTPSKQPKPDTQAMLKVPFNSVAGESD